MRPTKLQAAVGGGFVGIGTLHFTHTRWFERIVPPYVPRRREAVLVSGVAEIAGGVGVLAPATRPVARWWLLSLLAAVYPANVHMAVNSGDFKEMPAWSLWARLPVQFVFALLVWRATAD